MIPELDPVIAGPVGAWIATYLVHGALLFAVAWTVALCARSHVVREQLWRVALVGPLVTASIQVGAGVSPLGGTFQLPGGEAAATAEVEREVVTVTPAALAAAQAVARSAPAPAPEPDRGAGREDAGLHRAATLLLALGIGSLTLRALLEALRMRRLGDRAPLDEPAFEADLEELRNRAGLRRRVRLERAALGVSPYATGLLRPRIVVPDAIAGDLDRRGRRALLAHELGHVARLDAAWSGAARAIASLFCFQPLGWIILKRLDECAEFACDEFAVQLTRDEVGLARCLTSIAERILGGAPERAIPACPMAKSDSKLGERVQRILAASHDAPRRRVVLRGLALALVASTAAAAPTIARSAVPEPGATQVTLEITQTGGTTASLAEVFDALAREAREIRAATEGLTRETGARPDVAARLEALQRRAAGVESLALRVATSLRARAAARNDGAAPLPRSR